VVGAGSRLAWTQPGNRRTGGAVMDLRKDKVFFRQKLRRILRKRRGKKKRGDLDLQFRRKRRGILAQISAKFGGRINAGCPYISQRSTWLGLVSNVKWDFCLLLFCVKRENILRFKTDRKFSFNLN
jgi:hypothetical protein